MCVDWCWKNVSSNYLLMKRISAFSAYFGDHIKQKFYELNVTYGIASASFLATRALRQLGENYSDNFCNKRSGHLKI